MDTLLLQMLKDIWIDIRTSNPFLKLLYLLFFLFIMSLFFPKMREAFKEYVMAMVYALKKDSIIDWFRISLFKNEQYLIERAKDIYFDDAEKTYIFATILKIKVKVTIGEVKKYVDDLVSKRKLKVKKEDLLSELKLLIELIVDRYEKEIEMEFIKKYGQETGKKVFDCVYYGKINGESRYGFKEYHSKNIDIIYKGLNSSLETPIDQPDFMLYNFLINVHTALSLAVGDLATVFKDFNGELIKLIHGESKKHTEVISNN